MVSLLIDGVFLLGISAAFFTDRISFDVASLFFGVEIAVVLGLLFKWARICLASLSLIELL